MLSLTCALLNRPDWLHSSVHQGGLDARRAVHGIPLDRMRSDSLGRSEARAGSGPLGQCARRAVTAPRRMIRTDRLRSCPAGSRILPRGLGRTRGAAAGRKEFIGDGGRGCRTLARPSRIRDQPRVHRFPAGGDHRSLGGCSAVARSAGLTLPRPRPRPITRSLAGCHSWLSVPEILNSQGPIARSPLRLPKGVRSSRYALNRSQLTE